MKHGFWSLAYNWLLYPALKTLAHLVSIKNRKIRTSLNGKRNTWHQIPQTILNRDQRTKPIWFHAPSAGEFIQLQPLLETFLKENYDCVVTYNSISAEKWIEKTSLQAPRQPLFSGYLPFDTRHDMREWIRLMNPAALVFIKYDLWPNAIWETQKAGIPIYLVSATLHGKTKRYASIIGRSLYADLYSRFKRIFVVEETDKRRFLETSQSLRHIEVFGDIRYDATLAQRERKKLPESLSHLLQKNVFIVGSSWPPDERCVFPGLKAALKEFLDLFLIIAPHEPTESHIKGAEDYFSEFGTCRLSCIGEQGQPESRVVLIDTVGVLSAIYQVGTLAYVGGGFTTGVHNVMEPCAMGLPVFFGPLHHNSGEALQLTKDCLAFPVENAEDFRIKLLDLLSNPDKCARLGEKARRFVESQAGATHKCFQVIDNDLRRTITQD